MPTNEPNYDPFPRQSAVALAMTVLERLRTGPCTGILVLKFVSQVT